VAGELHPRAEAEGAGQRLQRAAFRAITERLPSQLHGQFGQWHIDGDEWFAGHQFRLSACD